MSIFKRLKTKASPASRDTLETSRAAADDIASSIRAELDQAPSRRQKAEPDAGPKNAPTDIRDTELYLDTPIGTQPSDDKPGSPDLFSLNMKTERDSDLDAYLARLTLEREEYENQTQSPEPDIKHSHETRAAEDPTKLSLEDLTRPLTNRMDLSELRLDVVRISSDIDSGEALYRRAQQRVESLIGFVEKAEIAAGLVDKMEPENRRLKARNRSLETELEAQGHKVTQLSLDHTETSERLDDAKIKLAAAKDKLTEALSALEDNKHQIESLNAANTDAQIQTERVRTSLEIETRENITLREKLTEMSAQAEALTGQKVDAAKNVETLRADYDDMSSKAADLRSENSELLLKLRNAQRQNEQMREDLVDIQDKITAYKSQHETSLHKRDDKIITLEAKVADLEAKLKHKDDVVHSAVLDVSQLRKARSAQDMQREKLEKIIAGQNTQLSKAEEDLLRSKRDMDDLDHRYKDVAAALVIQRKRRTAASIIDPDIYPAMDTEDDLADAAPDLDAELPRQNDNPYASDGTRLKNPYY